MNSLKLSPAVTKGFYVSVTKLDTRCVEEIVFAGSLNDCVEFMKDLYSDRLAGTFKFES